MTTEEIDYFITALRERLTVAERVVVDMKVSVTHLENHETGLMESQAGRGTTIVIEIDGGAREIYL